MQTDNQRKSENKKGPRHTRCCAFLVNNRNEVMLLQHQNKKGQIFWLFPGGGLEEGESHEECIRRELREELGLEIEISEIIYVMIENPNIISYKRHCVGIGTIPAGQEIVLEPDGNGKILQYKWFDISDEKNYDPVLLEDDIFPILKEAIEYIN